MCWGGIWAESGFTVALFQGWGGGRVKYCWNRCGLTELRNKSIIVLICGLLVDNNRFSKLCIFKNLSGYTGDGGYKN